jgi:hypothetical protein
MGMPMLTMGNVAMATLFAANEYSSKTILHINVRGTNLLNMEAL